VAAFLKAVAK